MATNILAAVRQCPQLHGNLKFTALEVAHLMNRSGYGRIAYQYLAYKTGSSRRTMIRHMHRLIALGIVEKTVYKLQQGYAINLYKCVLSRHAFYQDRPTRSSGDRLPSILPDPKTEEAKELSLTEEIQRLTKGLRFTTEGSLPWQATREKLTALERLQHGGAS